MTGVYQDLRYSLRVLRANRMYTIVTVLTIALGVGVNTALFTLINAVIFRATPVEDPQSLFEVGQPLEAGLARRFQQECRSCRAVVSTRWVLPTLGEMGDGPVVHGNEVSANYFAALGVQPALGRVFAPADNDGGAIVLNFDFWKRQLNGNPAVLGERISLGGRSYTVLGVAREGFFGTFPLLANFWTLAPRGPDADRELVRVMVRLRPGVLRETVEEELTAIRGPGRDAADRIRLQSRATLIPLNPATTALSALLLACSGLVLLVACANVANVALARSAARVREISVRLAMGASRGRLVRQLLAESVTISLLGGVAALFVAAWTLPALTVLLQSKVPAIWGHWEIDLRADARVFAFTAAVCFLAAVLFGLMPALQATRVDLVSGLKDGGGQGARRSQSRWRGMLVVVQVALCMVLLVNAGLLAKSLANSYSESAGFDTERVSIVQLDTREWETDRGLAARMLERLAAVPGVESVAMGRSVPLLGSRFGSIGTESGTGALTTAYNRVGAEYFATLGIPVVAGRGFRAEEVRNQVLVVVLSEKLAKRLFARESAVGRTVYFSGKALAVIGVARDARSVHLSETDPAFAYVPILPEDLQPTVHFFVRSRTAGGMGRLQGALRLAAAEVAAQRQVLVYSFDMALGYQRLPAQGGSAVGGFLGLLALGLAAVGLYGVISYTVSQRTREFGVRIALGATRSDIQALVLGQGARLAATGLGVGIVGALPMAFVLRAALPGLSPMDIPTFGGVSLFLAVIAVAAMWAPTARASRVEPSVALRQD